MTESAAAEFSRKAAAAGYLPSLAFNADYGRAGSHRLRHRKYRGAGTLSIPIFEGGSVHGDVCRPMRDSSRAANVWIISAHRSTPTFARSAEPAVVGRASRTCTPATLIWRTRRFLNRVIVSVRVSPIPWKWCKSQEAVASAHELYISSLYSTISQKSPWLALWALLKRA